MNVLITGASKGIGKALAVKFATTGENRLFLCARNETALNQVKEELAATTLKANVEVLCTDVTSVEEVTDLYNWTKEHTPLIDVLINNAGDFLPGSIYNETEGTLERMMEANLYSAYKVTRAFLPMFIEAKAGHIFNMCSIASLQAYANGGSYSISKFALAGFTKNLREELKPYNIKVTAVYPGAVYTGSWAESGIEPSRIMEVNDVAEMVYAACFLSPQACVEEIVMRPLPGDL